MKKITALDWINSNIKSEDLYEDGMNLGLNKHAKKKHNDIDAIVNINDYVDLGLASGNLWSKYNYGANEEYEGGKNISYSDAMSTDFSPGDLPTHNDFVELIRNCTRKPVKINGVEGLEFTSKINDESIFFPFGNSQDGYYSRHSYWSSTQHPKTDAAAYNMQISSYGLAYMNYSAKHIKYLVKTIIKKTNESENLSLGLNKRAKKEFIDNQEKYKDEFNDAISNDLMSSEDFLAKLKEHLGVLVVDYSNVVETFGSRTGTGVIIDRTIDGDDMKFKLYLCFKIFDDNFIQIENGFTIGIYVESTTGYITCQSWNLNRKSWKDFDKAFCDLREQDKYNQFQTTNRALAQVLDFTKAFVDNADDIWEEGILANSQNVDNIYSFFLNLKHKDIKKFMIPVFRKYLLNNL